MVNKIKIGVVGLGYVGGPLAQKFAECYPVIGYDVNTNRIQRLNRGIDDNLEINPDALIHVLKMFDFAEGTVGLKCVDDINALRECDVYIITVPTPVDEHNYPDLSPIINATEKVANILSKGNVVIYESTVYPGVTEEKCAPILEEISELVFNTDFFVGYSPERINPGDRLHSFENIKKIVSGSTVEATQFIDKLYNSILKNGTYVSPSIKVAESAKIIENIQRDVNIALMNELARIFNEMGIDTREVIEAASTKWNFVAFQPGLVGGHCIGVDPYYMIQKAKLYGYMPNIMTEARILNDSMASYIVTQVVKLMNVKGILVKNASILILGYTFKENCPDTRNTKIKDLVVNLKEYTTNIVVHDPWVSSGSEFPIAKTLDLSARYDVIIGAVPHSAFKSLDVRKLLSPGGVVYDIKGMFDKTLSDARL